MCVCVQCEVSVCRWEDLGSSQSSGYRNQLAMITFIVSHYTQKTPIGDTNDTLLAAAKQYLNTAQCE